MYKFIQKNRKVMLAIFGVLLMIVFIIPSTSKNSFSRGEMVIGRVGDLDVYGDDEAQAKEDLRLLSAYQFQPLFAMGGGGPRGGGARQAFEDHPLLYALLQKEAQSHGFGVSNELVDRTMQNYLPPENRIPGNDYARLRTAVGNFMLVQALYDRAVADIKVSTPL